MTHDELIVEITEESVTKKANEIVAQRMAEADRIVDECKRELALTKRMYRDAVKKFAQYDHDSVTKLKRTMRQLQKATQRYPYIGWGKSTKKQTRQGIADLAD